MTDRADNPNGDNPNGHDRYDEWDAAYVLGALSSAERHEYEKHLSECPRCAAAVSELAGMPGLLGALPAEDAFSMLDADATGADPAPILDGASEPPTDILSGLTARVRRRRRARAWTAGVVGVAAAAAVAAAIVLPMSLNAPAPPTLAATLSPVSPSAPQPITASVELTSVKWGTKIAVSCSYSSDATTLYTTPPYTTPPYSTPSYGAESARYGLYVTDVNGTTTRVSSWRGWPGATVNTTASTEMRESDIARIELRSLDTGAVLLRRSLT